MNGRHAAQGDAADGGVADAADRVACRAELQNLPQLLALVAGIGRRLQLDAQTRHDLQLIAEEACVNVMRHAYPSGQPGPLLLAIQVVQHGAGRRIVLTLQDQGPAFDPLSVAAVDAALLAAPAEARTPGGLGVHMIRRLSDQQHYRRDPQHGNVLTIEKQLPPVPSD